MAALKKIYCLVYKGCYFVYIRNTKLKSIFHVRNFKCKRLPTTGMYGNNSIIFLFLFSLCLLLILIVCQLNIKQKTTAKFGWMWAWMCDWMNQWWLWIIFLKWVYACYKFFKPKLKKITCKSFMYAIEIKD